MGTKQGPSSEPAAAACGKADRTNTNLRATAASGTTCSGPVAGCLWTVGIRAVAVTEASSCERWRAGEQRLRGRRRAGGQNQVGWTAAKLIGLS